MHWTGNPESMYSNSMFKIDKGQTNYQRDTMIDRGLTRVPDDPCPGKAKIFGMHRDSSSRIFRSTTPDAPPASFQCPRKTPRYQNHRWRIFLIPPSSGRSNLIPNFRARAMLQERPVRTVFLVLSLLPLVFSCRSHFPAEQVPKMQWLILPFNQPPEIDKYPRVVKGWWFQAKTIRKNPRGGEMLSDNLRRAMSELEFINMYTTIDLSYYFADKRELLAEAFPQLSRSDIDSHIQNVPKLRYARELGADKMLSGRIVRHYMAENRAFHWWWCVLEVDCSVIDVKSGQEEWNRHYELTDSFVSQQELQEKLIGNLIQDLKQEYFLYLARE